MTLDLDTGLLQGRFSDKFLYFTAILFLIAACCLAGSLMLSPISSTASSFCLWIFLSLLGQQSRTALRLGRYSLNVNPGQCITVAAYFLYGLSFALCVNLIGSLLHYALKRQPLYRAGVVAGATTIAYTMLHPLFAIKFARLDYVTLTAFVISFQACSGIATRFIVACIQAVETNTPLRKVFGRYVRKNFARLAQDVIVRPCFTLSFIAVCLVQPWLSVALFFPFEQLKSRMEARDKTEKSLKEGVEVLSRVLSSKDQCTVRHTERVQRYAECIARHAGLSDQQVLKVGLAAKIHDIGKLFVKEEILKKKTALSRDEYEQVKKHVKLDAMLEPLLQEKFPIAEILHVGRLHHERYDGKGYPFGLKGEEIPVEARIIALADAWDAMTAGRIYQKRVDDEKALALLRQGAGGQWDPKVVESFFEAYASGEIRQIGAGHKKWLIQAERDAQERFAKILAFSA